ncbi:MAG: ABC transporter permease, partial [Myxococcota bacterium]
DWSVLAFALAVGLATGVLFGFAPAIQAARRETTPALRASAPAGFRRLLGRKALVTAQLALSLVLLAASSLLLRALSRAGSIDVGFDPEGVETFAVDLGLAGYSEEQLGVAQAELAERLATLPAVDRAAFAAVLPLNFDSMGFGGVVAERPVPGAVAPEYGHEADVNVVTPDYFATLGITVRGRVFDARDTAASPKVAVITQSMARLLFGERDPLGEAFLLDPRGDELRVEVVGVVRDGRFKSLGTEPEATFFVPSAQFARGYGYILLESHGDRAALARSVAAEVAAFDADIPRPELRPLEAIAANSTLPQRVAVSVAGSLGILGVTLAAIGLYGLLA